MCKAQDNAQGLDREMVESSISPLLGASDTAGDLPTKAVTSP